MECTVLVGIKLKEMQQLHLKIYLNLCLNFLSLHIIKLYDHHEVSPTYQQQFIVVQISHGQ